MQLFYTPDILANSVLPEEESGHCVRVLRLNEGDQILLTDGQGSFYKAAISQAHPKHCGVELLERWREVLINIDQMIIDDCKDLFMLIY